MKSILFFTTLFICITEAKSQHDTIYHSIEIESADSVKFNNQEKLKDMYHELVEADRLWKLNVASLIYPGISTSFEKRIKEKLSYEVGVIAPTFLWNTKNLGLLYSSTAWTELRFYHWDKIRKRKGKKTHSLFGNYIAIGITSYLSNLDIDYENRPTKEIINDNTYWTTREEIAQYPTLLIGNKQAKGYMLMGTIKYGIQLPLSEFGFIELQSSFGAGKSLTNNRYYQNLTVQLKFGLDFYSVSKANRNKR